MLVHSPKRRDRQSLFDYSCWAAKAKVHTIRRIRKPPLIRSILMYIGILSEYIALRLSRSSLAATSEDRTIMVLVPKIREYIGLDSYQNYMSGAEVWTCGLLTRILEPISETGDGNLAWASVDVSILPEESRASNKEDFSQDECYPRLEL